MVLYVIDSADDSRLKTSFDCTGAALSFWVDVIPVNDTQDPGVAIGVSTSGSEPNIGAALMLQNIGSVGTPNWQLDARRYYTGGTQGTLDSGLSYTLGTRIQLGLAAGNSPSTGFKSYKDGSLLATSSTTTGTARGSGNYYLGFPAGEFFGSNVSRLGDYYRWAVWDVELTATDFLNLKNGADPASIAGLRIFEDFTRVELGLAPLKQTDLNPLTINSNVSGATDEVKAGIFGGPVRVFGGLGAPDAYVTLAEVIASGSPPPTSAARMAGPTLQALRYNPPISSPSAGPDWVWSPTGAQNNEAAPSCLIKRWDGVPGFFCLYHGADTTTGTIKQIGVKQTSGDYSAQAGTWVEAATFPIIAVGTTGTWDAKLIAGAAAVRFPDTGEIVVMYAGYNASNVLAIGRASGTSWGALTKDAANPVIAAGAATFMGSGGCWAGIMVLDPQGRLHMWPSRDDATSTGYAYSDDRGKTWTIASAAVLTFDSPEVSAGDTIALLGEGDSVSLFYGRANVNGAGYDEGRAMAVLPYTVASPVRPARWYYPSGQPYTTQSGGVLNRTAFTIAARGRWFRYARASQTRVLYGEWIDSSNQCNIAIVNGLLVAVFKVAGTTVTLSSTVEVDDAKYHEIAFGLTGGVFDLRIDGAVVASASSGVGTTATTPTTSVGNWQTSVGTNSPLRGMLSDLVVLTTYAASWRDVSTALNTKSGARQLPAGATAAIDFPSQGTDTNGPVVVEGAAPTDFVAVAPDYQPPLQQLTPPFWPPRSQPVSTTNQPVPVAATIAAAITDDFTAAITAQVATPVDAVVAASIDSDFSAAVTISEAIPATLAASIADDFTAAAAVTVANPVDASVAAVITDDFSAAVAASESIPATVAASIESDFACAVAVALEVTTSIAASIEGDFSAAVTSTVANPVSAAVAATITDDFTAAVSVVETIPAAVAALIGDDFGAAITANASSDTTVSVAAAITDDFSAAVTATETITGSVAAAITGDFSASATLTHSVDGDLVVAATITSDFAAAVTAAETLPSSVAADITSDFSAAVTVLLEVQVSGACEIANDFSAAVSISEALPVSVAASIEGLFIVAASATVANDGTIAATIAPDFTAALSMLVIQNVDGSAAADITADFVAAITMQSGSVFVAATRPGRKIAGGTYNPNRRRV